MVGGKVPEKLFQRLWHLRVWEGRWLKTMDGRRLRLVRAGEFSHEGGPDFRSASVLFEDGRHVEGDVELDLEPGLWQAHGHHLNPAFNGVILHAVLFPRPVLYTRLQDGRAVPIVCMLPYLPVSVEELPAWAEQASGSLCPCRTRIRGVRPALCLEQLDLAGDKRFFAKAVALEEELRDEEAGQVLYRGIMVSLGYSQNKQAFLELADRLPLKELEGKSRVVQEGLLLGCAGLLSPGRWVEIEPYFRKLERWWRTGGVRDAMSVCQWRFFRVRPENFPARRLAAMSLLLYRYRRQGLLRGLINLVQEAYRRASAAWIDRGMTVHTTGYWMTHFDVGRPLEPGYCSTMLLGLGRAATVVVDVVLPFMYAYGRCNSEPELCGQALELYRRHPSLPENHITRRMRQRIFAADERLRLPSARRQQGLIHVYKNYCLSGKKCRLFR